MNCLPLEKRVKIINLLVEGNSLRSTARLEKVAINTVVKLMISVGKACLYFHDKTVVDIAAKRIQTDEIWAFVQNKEATIPYKKNKDNTEGTGDMWTWISIDADTKLVVSWFNGRRDAHSAYRVMADLKKRLANRVQMSTDGFLGYSESVMKTFEWKIDYAQLVKIYGRDEKEVKAGKKQYGRQVFKRAEKTVICGNPDLNHLSTSYIERLNLTLRMHNRRFIRKTNAFSKKALNHMYSQAITFAYYNFVRIHQTLGVTPAMKAEIVDYQMKLEDFVILAANSK